LGLPNFLVGVPFQVRLSLLAFLAAKKPKKVLKHVAQSLTLIELIMNPELVGLFSNFY